jgi:hypothetical protein
MLAGRSRQRSCREQATDLGHAWLHDCLAFADAETAAKEADDLIAIATAPTLGAAAAIKTQYISNPAKDTVEDGVDEPDEPMDIFRCYGVEDGDWPPMVTSRALSLLPAAIQAEFGTVILADELARAACHVP